MTARRVAQKAIDWVAFAERVPPNQKSQFNALKGKADALKARYNATPEQPAALNWDMYRKTITVPGLVDKFEQQYKAVKVPYPQDTMTVKIDAQEKEMDKLAAEWKIAAEKTIAQYEVELKKFTDMVPFEEMTRVEFEEYFPEQSLEERKKIYPHFPHMSEEDLQRIVRS